MATATLPKKINYPSSDGKPMAETDYHVSLIVKTLDLLQDYYSQRDDVYIAGNNFVYYVEGDPKKRLSPDTYIVFGVPNRPRTSYRVWEEGKYPDVVIEYTSKKTKKEDTQQKFEIYQSIWQVKEYFLFDPTSDHLKGSPTGYRLIDGVYQAIERVNGRMTSEVLGFTLERSRHLLMFRDAKTGEPILRKSERELIEANHEIELLKQQLAKLQNPSGNGH